MTNSSVRYNRGYGVFVNTTHGDVAVVDTVVADNGADGIRCIRANPRLDDQFDRSDVHDFCMFPTTMSQTYPISVLMEQGLYNPTNKECSKVCIVRPLWVGSSGSVSAHHSSCIYGIHRLLLFTRTKRRFILQVHS